VDQAERKAAKWPFNNLLLRIFEKAIEIIRERILAK
jgi:hypothetical protein